MKITSGTKLGYIYLMPEDYSANWQSETNIYIFRESGVNIPFFRSNEMSDKLDEMEMVNKSFWLAKADNDIGFYYPSDRKGDYISGIELELPSTKFMKFIRDEVYRVFKINWLNKSFDLVLLDREKKVFSKDSVIYPLNEARDVFVIIAREEDDFNSIVALISSRNDIYPTDYLITPQFMVY